MYIWKCEEHKMTLAAPLKEALVEKITAHLLFFHHINDPEVLKARVEEERKRIREV